MQKLPRTPLRWAFALVALSALLAMPAHAQWKWRDKDGRITVSDRPPPKDVPDADILGRPDPHRVVPASVPASAASAALVPSPPHLTPLEQEVEARKRSADQERAAKARIDEERNAAQRAENCRRARSQEMALQSGQRMARVNEKGEREVLDDKGRAEELRVAREAIASDCR